MGEKTYLIENRFTGKKVNVPQDDLSFYRDAREPYSGEPMYNFLEDVKGAQTLDDGSLQEVTIPADKIHATASHGSPYVLPYAGLSDQVKIDERQRKIKEIAGRESFGEVTARSFASGLTAGASTALLDYAYGKDYEEIRQASMQNQRGGHFLGRALSLVALGALPIPGLAKATGFSGAKNVGSIFELGTAISSRTRAGIVGDGFFKEFARRLGGSMSYAAVVEAPLSFALASADIVDNNKEYTAEAISGEFLTQYGLALGIAGVTSIPFALGGAALRSLGKPLVETADRMLTQAAAGPTSAIAEAAVTGGTRYFGRKFLRGKALGAGDFLDNLAYRIGRKAIHGHTGRLMSETPIGRWLAGADVEDLVRYQRTYGEAINAITEAETPRQLREAVDVLRFNAQTPKLASRLSFIYDNADDMIAARRQLQQLIKDADDFSSAALKAKFVHPKGMVPAKGVRASVELQRGLQLSMDNPPKLTGDRKAMLDQVLEIRRTIEPGRRSHLDAAIIKSYQNAEKYLSWMDKYDRSARNIQRMVKEYKADASGVRGAYNLIGPPDDTNINSFRANIRALDGTYRGLSDKGVNAIRNIDLKHGDEKFFVKKGEGYYSTIDTRLNDLRNGIEALGEANAVHGELFKGNASPIIPAPVPRTQAERLAAQVDTVITTKKRVKVALMYIGMKGGGIRHTVSFGGVFLFRGMNSFNEKKQAFTEAHDALINTAANPESLQAHVSDLVAPAAIEDIGLGASLAATQVAAYSYLLSQLPTTSDPIMRPEDFSGAEIENFLEALGAIMEPVSVLATAADGSTTEQAVDALRKVYPELYMDMVLDVAEFVDEYGHKLGHAQLLGLDTFTGYALGYSDGPAPNLTYQQPYYQTTGQAASAGAVGGPENRRLDVQLYSTPAQKVGAL